MANFVTYIGDQQVLLEAPASSAFEKSESEVEADPRKAITTIIKTIAMLAEALGEQITPIVKKSGADMELSFGVRSDAAGMVMIAQVPNDAQFQVTMGWQAEKGAPAAAGPPPGRPRPPGARPPGARPPGARPGPGRPRPRPPGPPPGKKPPEK